MNKQKSVATKVAEICASHGEEIICGRFSYHSDYEAGNDLNFSVLLKVGYSQSQFSDFMNALSLKEHAIEYEHNLQIWLKSGNWIDLYEDEGHMGVLYNNVPEIPNELQ